MSTGKWTLICRFDTGLYYSYFQGGMSQFMENYDSMYANEARTFEYRNIRVREYRKKNWKTIKTSLLSADTFTDNKKGNAVYGATTDRFYGITNGYGSDAFEMDEFFGDIYTIKPIKNLYIPSTKGKNKPTQILIDGASLSKSNKVKKVTLKGLKKSKVKKYKKWIRQANKRTKVTVK